MVRLMGGKSSDEIVGLGTTANSCERQGIGYATVKLLSTECNINGVRQYRYNLVIF